MPNTTRSPRLPPMLAVLLLLVGCDRQPPARPRAHTPAAPATPVTPANQGHPPPGPAPTPDLRLVVLTDLQGYLEPCGCQRVPLGGIDRAATKLAELRRDGVPTAVLSVGDLLAEAPGIPDGPAGGASPHSPPGGAAGHGAPPGAETQERWKAEVLAGILRELGLAASVLGVADGRFGASEGDRLAAATGSTLLGPQTPHIVLERGGHRIGVWGLRADADADATALGAQAATWSAALRAQGAEVVVGLLSADQRTARRLAGTAGAADLIVLGGLHRDDPVPPSSVGDATVLTGGQHGRGLLVVDLTLPGAGPGPFVDASDWTLTAQRESEAQRAEDLAARIAAWEGDPAVDPAQLQAQRARLASMRRGQQALHAPAPTGRALRARYEALSPDVPSDPATKTALGAYDQRVNAHNREAFADLRPPPVPAGSAGYVGSERCRTCHVAAYQWWQGHPHGRAYTTLQTRHKEFNLSCVGCHVTGYGKPGGSTVTHNEGLVHVGCEACHGPGSLHPKKRGTMVRAPDAVTCVGCHNAEHSDQFDFATYRAKLLAPGHGLPVEEHP